MDKINLQALTSSFYLYIAIGAVALFALGLTFYLLTKRQKLEVNPLDPTLIENLYQALGTKTNIKQVEIVQKRLQIEVGSVKNIDQEKLKALNMPAFVTGKKITILIKDNTKEVYQYLIEKRKEEV
jgi:phosphotransferase system IIB component